jgi:mannose-6-phosphate isomerase-like protein (cupin superfamily)
VYDPSDPRSALATATATAAPPRPAAVAAPEYHDFSRLAPDEVSAAGSRSWIVRAQNVVLVHVRPVAGDALEPTDLDSEQVVILAHDSSAARFATAAGEGELRGRGVVILPPGRCEITALGDGDLVRLVEAGTPWAERARNAASYAEPHPNVAPLEPWPEPSAGPALRIYPLADVPDEPGRFGRIFRSRSFMVNFLDHNDGPRDRTKLSPHHHDDFEQISLAVEGEFTHHIRTPWGTDATQWRDDDHVTVGSPSVTIIPPPTIHTTEAVGSGRNQLIDIFSGPRTDFSARPGWVLNASEYPAPDARS